MRPPDVHKSIIILGAGPTGLGSAMRLNEQGCGDWLLLEACNHAGGLASSFKDGKGFTWDVGGHVQFSHYDYFDDAMDELLGSDGWLHHQRESWVWMRERFIPYPFQYNLHRLPAGDLERCLAGLRSLASAPGASRSLDFQQWMEQTFGAGITDVFMRPYNRKVWAFPPEMMSAGWVGERVAVTDLERVLRNVASGKDDTSWGPNNTFRFPKHGGTGAIWSACAAQLPKEKLIFNAAVTRVDLPRHEVSTADGRTIRYDHLVSTMPLTELIRLSGAVQLAGFAKHDLLFSTTNIVGLGLIGKPRAELHTKCWMYFPEENCPFYRATVFSNYSQGNVPDITRHWSLMLEVSESPYKPVEQESLVEEVIQGALNTHLIENKNDIVSIWHYRAPYGYPVPTLNRDKVFSEIIPYFEQYDVYSRGRFGLWKYEVSNQDHSFMQGVEVVERLLGGRAEVTAFDCDHANSKKHSWPFERWKGASCLGVGGDPARVVPGYRQSPTHS